MRRGGIDPSTFNLIRLRRKKHFRARETVDCSLLRGEWEEARDTHAQNEFNAAHEMRWRCLLQNITTMVGSINAGVGLDRKVCRLTWLFEAFNYPGVIVVFVRGVRAVI
jgi:hypothetical protein